MAMEYPFTYHSESWSSSHVLVQLIDLMEISSPCCAAWCLAPQTSSTSSCSSEKAVTPCSLDTSREVSGGVSRGGVLELVDMKNIERLVINVRAALDSLQSRHALSAAYTDDLDSSDYILSLQAMEGLLLVAPIDQVITGEWVVKGNGRYWRCKDCAVMTSRRYGTVLYQSKMKIKNWVLLAHCFTERHRTLASIANEASFPQEGYMDRTLSTRTINRWFGYFRM